MNPLPQFADHARQRAEIATNKSFGLALLGKRVTDMESKADGTIDLHFEGDDVLTFRVRDNRVMGFARTAERRIL